LWPQLIHLHNSLYILSLKSKLTSLTRLQNNTNYWRTNYLKIKTNLDLHGYLKMLPVMDEAYSYLFRFILIFMVVILTATYVASLIVRFTALPTEVYICIPVYSACISIALMFIFPAASNVIVSSSRILFLLLISK